MTLPSYSNLSLAYVALSTIPACKPSFWRTLIHQYGSSATALINENEWRTLASQIPENLRGEIDVLRKTVNWKAVAHVEAWLNASSQHSIVTESESVWPTGFGALSDAPLALFCSGDSRLLSQPQIAIVGSRRATRGGLDTATLLASQLAERGIVVTSGLAAGIDAAAHVGALPHAGRTIAFMGTGPDIVYPYRNRHLAAQIQEAGGLVVSEFLPSTPPRRHHFPRRNRLIAAISCGTLVIEATLRSGTLITANLAADLGREVFAVPGNIANPLTEGCHALIQQGAKLTVCVDDILEELPEVVPLTANALSPDGEKSEDQNLATDKLLDSVDFDVTGVDIIAERSALPVSTVMAELLEYELRGLVTPVPGGYVKLRGK